MRDERQKAEREKLDADCIVLNGDTEGSSRSCRSSNRGYLIRVLADGNGFGVYGLVDQIAYRSRLPYSRSSSSG